MTETECAECGERIVLCDNKVALDVPAVDWDGGRAQWTLMRFGDQVWATAGNPDPGGKAHTLHEHQPEDGLLV